MKASITSINEDSRQSIANYVICEIYPKLISLTGSGVEWAACSLIMGTGCRVRVYSLILDSSVGLSVGIQSAGDLVSETPGSNPAFSRGRQLVSFRFEYRLPVPEHRN